MHCEYVYGIYHSNASLKKKRKSAFKYRTLWFFSQENDLVWNPLKNILDWLQLVAAEKI